MRMNFHISRAASLSGIFLGLLSLLILTTSFFSYLEREALGTLILIALMTLGAFITTGYLIYSFRRSI